MNWKPRWLRNQNLRPHWKSKNQGGYQVIGLKKAVRKGGFWNSQRKEGIRKRIWSSPHPSGVSVPTHRAQRTGALRSQHQDKTWTQAPRGQVGGVYREHLRCQRWGQENRSSCHCRKVAREFVKALDGGAAWRSPLNTRSPLAMLTQQPPYLLRVGSVVPVGGTVRTSGPPATEGLPDSPCGKACVRVSCLCIAAPWDWTWLSFVSMALWKHLLNVSGSTRQQSSFEES